MWIPLRNFHRSEFGPWADKMCPRLLVLCDVFRDYWGLPVHTAYSLGVTGALGRHLGPLAESQHNYDKWGIVRAADLQPAAMTNRADLLRAFEVARQIGFTGIGLYPDHKPGVGLHVDTREDCPPGDPATWAAFYREGKQVYTPISFALEGKRP